MAKFILICLRNRAHDPKLPYQIASLCDRLVPDNIISRPPRIVVQPGLIQAVINPTSVPPFVQGALRLGTLIEPSQDWWNVGAEVPDGTFALVRSDTQAIELVTDIVGSRTIWYCQTENLFLASSSQRAIIALLGDFQFNEAVISWMLSAGLPGPTGGWDRRLQRVPGNSRLLFDRTTWNSTLQQRSVVFEPGTLSRQEYQTQLLDALSASIAPYRHLSWSTWQLFLSGGYDSRALLLLLLQQNSMPHCATIGLHSSRTAPHNDGYIARVLTDQLGLAHDYYACDTYDLPLETVFDRFLQAGEGRIDHLNNFMDGMTIYGTLFDAGVEGIMRGDEGFGWLPVSSAYGARQSVGAKLLEDHFSPTRLHTFDLPPQHWPEWMSQREDETLEMWRDRLYHEFRIPLVLASLNDPFYCYGETVNPLLARRLVGLARKWPDTLRTGKQLFKETVYSMSAVNSEIPFARYRSVLSLKDFCQIPHVVDIIYEELQSHHAISVLPETLRHYILSNMKKTQGDTLKVSRNTWTRIKRCMPQRLKDYFKQAGAAPPIHPNVLALRACLISKMVRMLAADAQAGITIVSLANTFKEQQ